MEVNPLDLDGYIRLETESKDALMGNLNKEYDRLSDAAVDLEFPKYHLYNYRKSEDNKINTAILSKIHEAGLIQQGDIKAFHDDKGSSSTPYKGDFPINYSPRWHFVYCLCIGDGHLRSNSTEQFDWFQKEKGTKQVIEVIRSLGFDYDPEYESARHGITIPQLIPKTAKQALEINEHSKNDIFTKSEEAGENYQIALLTAFFIDEAGISTGKDSSSEITIHQEGNLELLEKYGELLDEFNVSWNRNKKREGWTIRITSEGVHKLKDLFEKSEDLGIGLLHREEAFNQKAEIASKTHSQTSLRKDTSSAREKILQKHKGEEITYKTVKSYFNKSKNLNRRSKELLRNLEQSNKVKKTAPETYYVK
jgi:hypothetical protein